MAKALQKYKPVPSRIKDPSSATHSPPQNAALRQLAEQADASTATERLSIIQHKASAMPVRQLIKTEEVPINALQNPVKLGAREVLGGPENTTPAAILGAARASYQANLARGTRILDILNKRKVDPDNDFEPAEDEMSQEEMADKSAANSEKFKRLYKTHVAKQKSRPDMDYNIATRGKGGHEDAYTNMYSVENNAIETATNYGDRDPNRAKGDFLNNSEVFWNQWKTTVKKSVGGVRKKDSRRDAKTRELAQVTRAYISNGDSGLTAHYALPNSVYFGDGHTATFGPGQEEFKALLGTPNGRAVGYLLNDHFHEMDNQSHAGVDVDGNRSAFVFRFG